MPRGVYNRSKATATEAPLKVHIYPHFGEADKGDGGIRRVVEGQKKHLHKFGIQVVDAPQEADVIAFHATCPKTFLNLYPEKTFVAMCHGLYWSEYEWGNWSSKINNDVIDGIRIADAVITCSNWVANSIRRHTSRNTHVIYHGVDAEDWVGEEDTRDYVLWNKTRPDPVCDPDPMNQVAALMPNQKFISTFGREAPNVALVGKMDFEHAKVLIQKAGVYLCTTRETFGVGTLEALAAGVPVVGFNYAGQAEIISHKIDGYLVTPGDFQGLAEGIKWALANRDKISPKAVEKAKQFTWEKACEEYAEIFKETHKRVNTVGPRTTVVVTNYNLHDFLPTCLDSVLAQTTDNWECIVVDDTSPDPRGREIVEEYAQRDPRIRLIANEKNVYLAEARNIGIREARGKYILPLDADDFLAPEGVQLLADALDADRHAHVAYGNVLFVDEDGVTPTNFDEYFLANYKRKSPHPPGRSGWPVPFSHEMQINRMNLLPYSSMYRKTAWEQVGGYRRRLRTAEDADFWTRLSSYGFEAKMVTTADTLIYRNRLGSMSRKQGDVDWTRWFTWSRMPEITPAGAVTKEQLGVGSLDPILISVIIPVGPGHEKYVHDAIDSVAAQTFQNWECIVVNDTDNVLPELPAWVRVIETDGRIGTAASRNLGIHISRGRLFLPLDADDYLEPQALSFMWEAHKIEHEVIYSDFYQTDATGKIITIHECDDYDPKLLTAGKRTFKGETREGMIHSVTALTPKEHWVKVGGYDENLPGWEDWDFQLALGNIGVCSRRIAYPLFTYRKHTGFRRDQNYGQFEKSKEGILYKWSHLWEGKELMACGSCSARRSVIPSVNGQWGMSRPSTNTHTEDAVLIRYTGPRMGATMYKGTSGTKYYFAAGEEKYVLSQDVELFERMGDFIRVSSETAVSNEPILVAEGPPA